MLENGEPMHEVFSSLAAAEMYSCAIRGKENIEWDEGQRNTTAKHMSTLEAHGWKKYFRVDLMDAEGPDLELSIPEGKVIQKNFVGKNMKNYDSILVLSHFKGHPMGGYGGALKQLAIGCASSYGKAYVHGAGDPEKICESSN